MNKIDITPTWEAVLPLYLAAAKDGSLLAEQDLRRMAKLADAYVAQQKAEAMQKIEAMQKARAQTPDWSTCPDSRPTDQIGKGLIAGTRDYQSDT